MTWQTVNHEAEFAPISWFCEHDIKQYVEQIEAKYDKLRQKNEM